MHIPESESNDFYSFKPLRNSMPQSAGTGLGLPISSSISRLMGGGSGIKSEPGKGTGVNMTLRFPLAADRPLTVPEIKGPGGDGCIAVMESASSLYLISKI